jgi:nucleoside-diphosphate-sugar epimerase
MSQVIIGGGWLGTRVAAAWTEKVLITHKSGEFPLDICTSGYSEELHQARTILLTAPLHRLEGYRNLSNILGDFKGQLIYCSTTGIYPVEPGEYAEEDAIEGKFKEVEDYLLSTFSNTLILRLGGLMGEDRYLAKFYKDKPLPQPDYTVNYIHYKDIIGVIQCLLEKGINKGIYNVVAPLHPTKAEVFYAQTGVKLEGERRERIVLVDKLIKETGYRFRYPDPISFPRNF